MIHCANRELLSWVQTLFFSIPFFRHQLHSNVINVKRFKTLAMASRRCNIFDALNIYSQKKPKNNITVLIIVFCRFAIFVVSNTYLTKRMAHSGRNTYYRLHFPTRRRTRNCQAGSRNPFEKFRAHSWCPSCGRRRKYFGLLESIISKKP